MARLRDHGPGDRAGSADVRSLKSFAHVTIRDVWRRERPCSSDLRLRSLMPVLRSPPLGTFSHGCRLPRAGAQRMEPRPSSCFAFCRQDIANSSSAAFPNQPFFSDGPIEKINRLIVADRRYLPNDAVANTSIAFQIMESDPQTVLESRIRKFTAGTVVV